MGWPLMLCLVWKPIKDDWRILRIRPYDALDAAKALFDSGECT
jgi:hypothetical protein